MMLPIGLTFKDWEDEAVIQVDPTLLMTKRGQEWVRRTAAYGTLPVWCSYSYITAASRSEGCQFEIYRSGIGLWERRQYLPLDLAAALRPVRREVHASLPLRLTRTAYADAEVLLDIWSGLLAGHWLAARRPATFDALVQAEVTLIVRGVSDYFNAFSSATEDIGSNLAGALDRRTRFLANATIEGGYSDIPTLSVYDSGRGSYR
jgi:hypothetical protein